MRNANTRPKEYARQRRNYLLKKTAVGTTGVTFAILAVALGLLTLLIVLMIVQHDPHIAITIPISWAVPPGLATLLAAWLSLFCFKKSSTIVRVPAVREHVLTLPAEEVLLRGSDSSPASPDELLRAAHEGNRISSEELLRPTEQRKA